MGLNLSWGHFSQCGGGIMFLQLGLGHTTMSVFRGGTHISECKATLHDNASQAQPCD